MIRNGVIFGPCPPPQRERDYHIRSNFGKFYLIKTGFTLGEPVCWVKVFRLFKLEHMFFGVQSVDRVGRCTTSLFIGRASVFVFAIQRLELLQVFSSS